MNTTTTKQNTTRLQYLMRRHHLDVAEVAAMLERQEATVRQWIAGNRPISESLLEVLRTKLESRPRRRDPRTVRLFEIMESNSLTLRDVAKIVDRSEQTVRIWRCEAKIIPAHTLHFLEAHVSNKTAA
jgi:plasmid maintenance system antidote protein VapI